MEKLLIRLGLKRELTLDEYIISIRPKKRELSNILVTIEPFKNDNDNGPEEAGCLELV